MIMMTEEAKRWRKIITKGVENPDKKWSFVWSGVEEGLSLITFFDVLMELNINFEVKFDGNLPATYDDDIGYYIMSTPPSEANKYIRTASCVSHKSVVYRGKLIKIIGRWKG